MQKSEQNMAEAEFHSESSVVINSGGELVTAPTVDSKGATSLANDGLNDSAWWNRHQLRLQGIDHVSGYSVTEWANAVKMAKQADHRTIVVMYFFGGERRQGDIQNHIESYAAALNLQVLMITVDLATDSRWDLANLDCFHVVLELCKYYVDIVIGSPPCSTTSAARHILTTRGPRPIRFRNCFWEGRGDLLPWERARLVEANALYLHWMAIIDAVCRHGGRYMHEHPADRGCDPFASLFATVEFRSMEERAGGIRKYLDQCMFDAPAMKPTMLSSNFSGLDEAFANKRCPGESQSHVHTFIAKGKDSGGHFRTRRLQCYPAALSRAIASCAVTTIQKLLASGEGPTGYLHRGEAVPTSTCLSTEPGPQCPFGFVITNECATSRRHVILSRDRGSGYLHVDDFLVLVDKPSPIKAGPLMELFADQFESGGFAVPSNERQHPDILQKAVGYHVVQSPAQLRLPDSKRFPLFHVLLRLANHRKVEVETLRSIVGVILFGALLNRQLICIPFATFQFIEQFSEQRVEMWQSVRNELLMMARSVIFMVHHVSRPFGNVLFATDAMGPNSSDCGGFGIVATDLQVHELDTLRDHAEHIGKSIARVNGDLSGLKSPSAAIAPTVPFSRLPGSFFCPARWSDVQAGRWRSSDHVNLGELRAVVRLVQQLSANTHFHNHIHYSLQDNTTAAGALNKGRSSSWAINFLLRKKTSACLAGRLNLYLPWVQTSKMPADELSRRIVSW